MGYDRNNRGFSLVRSRWKLTYLFASSCFTCRSRSNFQTFLLPLTGLLVDQILWRRWGISAHPNNSKNQASLVAGRSRQRFFAF